MNNILLFTITVKQQNRDASGTPTGIGVRHIYASTGGSYSHPDAPAQFMDLVLDRSQVHREIFADGQAFGVGSHDYGYLDLVNNNGRLDWLADPDVFADEGDITIQLVTDRADYASALQIFSGKVASVDVGLDMVRVRFQDSFAIVLDQGLSESRRAGTGGLEGDSSMAGQTRTVVIGRASRVECPVVDSAHSVAEVCDRGPVSIDAVHIRGQAVTRGVERSSAADLMANTPAANAWDWYPGGYDSGTATAYPAYIRFGTSVDIDGLVTANLGNPGGAAASTAGQCLARLLAERAGVVLKAEDVTALDAANAAEVGGAWNGTTQLQTAINFLATTVGAGVWQDAGGNWRVTRVVPPTAPTVKFADLGLTVAGAKRDIQLMELEPLFTSRSNGGGVFHTVEMLYDRTHMIQDKSTLVSTTTTASLFGEEWRSISETNATIRKNHDRSQVLTVESAFHASADASAEAHRRLDLLYGRRRYRVVGAISRDLVEILELGTSVRLIHSRLKLAEGKDFLVLGFTFNFMAQTVELTVWG